MKQVMSIVMGSLDVMTPFQGMDFAFKCFVEKDGIILFPWAVTGPIFLVHLIASLSFLFFF